MNLISVAQAGEVLGLQRDRVSRLIREGRISAVKIGRAYVIDRAEVERFAQLPRRAGRPNCSVFTNRCRGSSSFTRRSPSPTRAA